MQETIRPAGVAKTTSHNKCQLIDRLKGAPEEDCTGTPVPQVAAISEAGAVKKITRALIRIAGRR